MWDCSYHWHFICIFHGLKSWWLSWMSENRSHFTTGGWIKGDGSGWLTSELYRSTPMCGGLSLAIHLPCMDWVLHMDSLLWSMMCVSYYTPTHMIPQCSHFCCLQLSPTGFCQLLSFFFARIYGLSSFRHTESHWSVSLMMAGSWIVSVRKWFSLYRKVDFTGTDPQQTHRTRFTVYTWLFPLILDPNREQQQDISRERKGWQSAIPYDAWHMLMLFSNKLPPLWSLSHEHESASGSLWPLIQVKCH